MTLEQALFLVTTQQEEGISLNSILYEIRDKLSLEQLTELLTLLSKENLNENMHL